MSNCRRAWWLSLPFEVMSMKTMKVSRCVKCGGTNLPVVDHAFRATIAGVPFERKIRVQKCSNCGEVYLSAGTLGDFELSAALALARAGVRKPKALKFMTRKPFLTPNLSAGTSMG